MNILFLGDIVGKRGREIIRDFLPSLKEEYNIDFTIANGENSAHGKGITYKIYNELRTYGIDAITMGNHTYAKKELLEHISKMDILVVPENIIDKVGQGYRVFEVNGLKLCVCNILGAALMGDYMSDPFVAYQKIIDHVKADIFFVDLHAEATAEKRIFAEYFGKNAAIVVGTHTHIQTADEAILKNGVAFISDVGMCGPYDSIIGRDKNECIANMVYHEKTRFEMCESEAILNAVVIEVDDNTKLPISIKRIQRRPY